MLLPALTPIVLLCAVLLITLAAWLGQQISRRRRGAALSAMAREWRMHYSPRDVFNLAPRIAPHLPTPGAANVRVRDLIYGNLASGHRYIFVAEYSVGVIRSRVRRSCVVSILEARGAATFHSILVAPCEMKLMDQYAWTLKNEDQLSK